MGTDGKWLGMILLSAGSIDLIDLWIYVVPKRTGTTNFCTMPKLTRMRDSPIQWRSVLVSDTFNFSQTHLEDPLCHVDRYGPVNCGL